MRLKDNIAIITGAASGIGAATAMGFAGEGAKLVLADVDEDSVGRVATAIREIGGVAAFAKTDVSSPQEVEAMARLALDQYRPSSKMVESA